MDKEELIAFLKEKLAVSVQIDSYREYYSSGFKVKVQLTMKLFRRQLTASVLRMKDIENERNVNA